MSASAPWNKPDDRENQSLRKQLLQVEARASTLQDTLNTRDKQLEKLQWNLADNVNRLQAEAERVVELEKKATKCLEDLRTETLLRKNIETTLAQATEKAQREAELARTLQLELDNYGANNASSARDELRQAKDRAALETRVKQLEASLRNAEDRVTNPFAPQIPGSRTLSVQEIALENQILVLQAENSRLMELIPSSRSHDGFPLTTPGRSTRTSRAPNAFSSGQFQSPRRHRRSSSLSPDLKITRLEQELERCIPFEAEVEATTAKLVKVQKDMLALENDKMAAERKAQREIAELKDLMEQKEDDIMELKRLLEEAPDGVLLQKQLKSKEEHLRNLTSRIGGLGETLEARSVELALLATRRDEHRTNRQRAHTISQVSAPTDDPIPLPLPSPPPSIISTQITTNPSSPRLRARSPAPVSPPVLSYPDPAPLLAKIEHLTSVIASKEEEILVARQASSDDTDPDSSMTLEEFSALRAECAALEKDLNDTQTSLENSRDETRQSRRALQLYKAEMQTNIANLESARKDLDAARSEIASLETQLDVAQAEALAADSDKVEMEQVQRDLDETRRSASEARQSMVRIDALEEELEECERRLEDERKAHMEQQTILESRLAAAHDALHIASVKISELESEFAAASRSPPPTITLSPPNDESSDHITIAHLTVSAERLRAERDDLRRSLAFIQQENRVEINTLELSINRYRASAERDQAELLASREQMAALDRALTVAIITLGNLETGAIASGSRERDLQDQLISAQSGLEHVRSELEKALAAADIADVNAQSELETSRREAAETHIKLTATQRNVGCLRSTAAASLLVVQNLQSRNDPLESELDRSQARLLESNNSLHAAGHEILRLQSAALASLLVVQSLSVNENDAQASTETISLSEVEELRELVAQLEIEKEELNVQLEEAIESWRDVADQLEAVRETCDVVEDERDRFQNHTAQLEEDLAAVKSELEESEMRRREHRDDQLLALEEEGDDSPTLAIAQQLRTDIDALELRILRRDEQIGIHQKEIMRLETNLKLAEEANIELTSELETAVNERECMVEDSAAARDARDAASAEIKALELALEAAGSGFPSSSAALSELEEELASSRQAAEDAIHLHDGQVVSLVGLIFDGVAKVRTMQCTLAESNQALSEAFAIEEDLQIAEDHRDQALDELDVMTAEHEHILRVLDAKDVEITALQGSLNEAREEIRQVHESLELAQSRDGDASKKHNDLAFDIVELEGRIASLVSDETRHSEENASLQRDLELTRAELSAAIQKVETLTTRVDYHALDLQQRQAIHSQELARVTEEHDNKVVEIERLEARIATLTAEIETERASWTRDIDEAASQRHTEVSHLRDLLEAKEQAASAAVGQHEAEISHLMAKCEGLTVILSEASVKEEKLIATIESHRSMHWEQTSALKVQLEQASQEINRLQDMLQSVSVDNTNSRAALESDLRQATERLRSHENNQHAAQQELFDARARLISSDATIQELESQRSDLQMQVQHHVESAKRTGNMQRYLEHHAKKVEGDLEKFKEELKQTHEELEEAQQTIKAATISHAQHQRATDQEIDSLRSELANMEEELKSSASSRQLQELEETIAQLREENREVEEDLSKKTREIEDFEDKFLELLKEKKRHLAKIDAMSKKIRRLEVQIDETVPSVPAISPQSATTRAVVAGAAPKVAEALPSRNPTIPARRERVVSSAKPRVASSSSNSAPFRPRSSTAPSAPLAPRSTTPQPLPSPPSEPRVDPEQRPVRLSVAPAAAAAPYSSKKKRRLPDDFEHNEGLPPRPIVAHSSPSRIRQIARGVIRSGFTPMRTNARKATQEEGAIFSKAASSENLGGSGLGLAGTDITNSPARKKKPPGNWLMSQLQHR